MRILGNAMLPMALIAAVAGAYAEPNPRDSRTTEPKPPRRFTDARKAEADAKRLRKAAKRATAVRHD